MNLQKRPHQCRTSNWSHKHILKLIPYMVPEIFYFTVTGNRFDNIYVGVSMNSHRQVVEIFRYTYIKSWFNSFLDQPITHILEQRTSFHVSSNQLTFCRVSVNY